MSAAQHPQQSSTRGSFSSDSSSGSESGLMHEADSQQSLRKQSSSSESSSGSEGGLMPDADPFDGLQANETEKNFPREANSWRLARPLPLREFGPSDTQRRIDAEKNRLPAAGPSQTLQLRRRRRKERAKRSRQRRQQTMVQRLESVREEPEGTKEADGSGSVQCNRTRSGFAGAPSTERTSKNVGTDRKHRPSATQRRDSIKQESSRPAEPRNGAPKSGPRCTRAPKMITLFEFSVHIDLTLKDAANEPFTSSKKQTAGPKAKAAVTCWPFLTWFAILTFAVKCIWLHVLQALNRMESRVRECIIGGCNASQARKAASDKTASPERPDPFLEWLEDLYEKREGFFAKSLDEKANAKVERDLKRVERLLDFCSKLMERIYKP